MLERSAIHLRRWKLDVGRSSHKAHDIYEASIFMFLLLIIN